jgi:large subunit ribosomal protein L4
MFDKKTHNRTLKPYDVQGSGRKPRPQKGSGRARLGNIRGSGKRRPGKSWGHIPKVFTYTIPVKMKLKGLVSALSAKLAEGKIFVIDELPEKAPQWEIIQ